MISRGVSRPWLKIRINSKRALIASMVCLLVSFTLWAFTLWNLAECKSCQLEFESNVAQILFEYTKTLTALESRQSSLENMVTDSNELRLTINELKRYNEKQLTQGWQTDQPKRLSIGGE